MRAHCDVASGRRIARIHPRTTEHAMRTLRLNPDELAVDTFHTAVHDGAWRGTVGAHEAPTVKTLCASLLASNPTCCPCTPMA
jgi:hypothetical protein